MGSRGASPCALAGSEPRSRRPPCSSRRAGADRLGRRRSMDVQLEPGDIFFSRSNRFLGKAIRFFTRRIGESRTKVNHVGIVVQGGTPNQAVVVEALRTVERHRLID